MEFYPISEQKKSQHNFFLGSQDQYANFALFGASLAGQIKNLYLTERR